MYYTDKINSLKRIFGTENIVLEEQSLRVDNKNYPIIDDVIILSDQTKYTDFVRKKLVIKADFSQQEKDFSKDIQYTFGSEWEEYSKILPEHQKEFLQYFDIVDLKELQNSAICDLGCGNGRWSYFLREQCQEIILVDFSDAIFIARKNLTTVNNCLFFMCDLKSLPFKNNFVNFLFSIGVLHHLPTPCLDEVRVLRKYSPKLLVYLYYALDNRPIYFRILLKLVTKARVIASKVKSKFFRKIFCFFVAYLIYAPLIILGRFLNLIKLGKFVPLYEFYNKKSMLRIKQDVYDRFFTGIEQRVARLDILKLKDTFNEVIISDNKPYWHFLCK